MSEARDSMFYRLVAAAGHLAGSGQPVLALDVFDTVELLYGAEAMQGLEKYRAYLKYVTQSTLRDSDA